MRNKKIELVYTNRTTEHKCEATKYFIFAFQQRLDQKEADFGVIINEEQMAVSAVHAQTNSGEG
jgi:hypothetical protein